MKTLILISVALLLVGCETKQDIYWDLQTVEPILMEPGQPQPCPPETVFVMPPGDWLKAGVYCCWHIAYWMGDSLKMQQFGPLPDSVFIPRED